MYQLIHWRKDGKFSTRHNSNVNVECSGEHAGCFAHLIAFNNELSQCPTIKAITPIENDSFSTTDVDGIVTVYEIIKY